MKTPEQMAQSLVQAWQPFLIQLDREVTDGLRDDIAGVIRIVYEYAAEKDELLAVFCHDNADLIDIGRREERGRALRYIAEVSETFRGEEAQTSPPPGRLGEYGRVANLLDRIVIRLADVGPALDPLPPTLARDRIAALEEALASIADVAHTPSSMSAFEKVLAMASIATRALADAQR